MGPDSLYYHPFGLEKKWQLEKTEGLGDKIKRGKVVKFTEITGKSRSENTIIPSVFMIDYQIFNSTNKLLDTSYI